MAWVADDWRIVVRPDDGRQACLPEIEALLPTVDDWTVEWLTNENVAVIHLTRAASASALF